MIYVFSFLRNCQWITKKLDKVTLLPALHDYPFLSEPWLYQTFKLFCQFIVGKWYCIDISTCILQVMNEAEHLNLYWSFVSYLLTFYFPILLPFFPTETIIIFMGWDFLHTKNINPFSLKWVITIFFCFILPFHFVFLFLSTKRSSQMCWFWFLCGSDWLLLPHKERKAIFILF